MLVRLLLFVVLVCSLCHSSKVRGYDAKDWDRKHRTHLSGISKDDESDIGSLLISYGMLFDADLYVLEYVDTARKEGFLKQAIKELEDCEDSNFSEECRSAIGAKFAKYSPTFRKDYPAMANKTKGQSGAKSTRKQEESTEEIYTSSDFDREFGTNFHVLPKDTQDVIFEAINYGYENLQDNALWFAEGLATIQKDQGVTAVHNAAKRYYECSVGAVNASLNDEEGMKCIIFRVDILQGSISFKENDIENYNIAIQSRDDLKKIFGIGGSSKLTERFK